MYYMDGVFLLWQGPFTQLLVIRCTGGESSAACVYALMPGKAIAIYEGLMEAVLGTGEAKGYVLGLAIIISDYEMAANRAPKKYSTKRCPLRAVSSTSFKLRTTRKFYSRKLLFTITWHLYIGDNCVKMSTATVTIM